MKFITQEALDDAVLFRLFVQAQSVDRRLSKDEVANLFEIPLSSKRIELAFDNLASRELIKRTFGSKTTVSIESSGYKFVENQLSKSQSFIRLYATHGDKWLENQTISLDGVPAADRIVRRSDNEKIFEEFDRVLDDVATELQKNNEVGAEIGDTKDLLVVEIESSKFLTRAARFRLSQLISLLMPALRYLADKFGNASIGEAAKRLIELLVSLV